MAESISQERDRQLRAAANEILEWVFFHLVKELRSAQVKASPQKMEPAVQSALVQALLGAVLEMEGRLSHELWVADWAVNARVWALQSVLGTEQVSRAKQEIARAQAAASDDEPPFFLCGMHAARNLDVDLRKGIDGEQWLEQYQGDFAAMARLYGTIG